MSDQDYGFGVEDFDLAHYPEVDDQGKMLFSVWRLNYLGKNGQSFFLNTNPKNKSEGKFIPHGHMVTSASRADRWTEPRWQDILWAEKEIYSRTEGKGTLVNMQIGLWWYQRNKEDIENGHWEETDSRLHSAPVHWLTVSNFSNGSWEDVVSPGYAFWRKKAFESREGADPWKPRIMGGGIDGEKIKNRAAQLKAEQEALEAAKKNENDELKKQIASLAEAVKALSESNKDKK